MRVVCSVRHRYKTSLGHRRETRSHDHRERIIILTQTSRHAVVFLERGNPATAAVRTEAKPCGGLWVRRDQSALSPVDNGDWPGRGLGFIPAAYLPTA